MLQSLPAPRPRRPHDAPPVSTLAKPVLKALRELARDHQSGSSVLSLRACEILETCAPAQRNARPGPPAHGEACADIARRVAAAQPSMAGVWNVSNCWLLAIERGERPAQAANRIARQLRKAQAAAVRHAAALIPGRSVVTTYSGSSTVLGALLLARKRGRRFRVLCSESRPLLEGRALAARLAAADIPVEFLTDAALFSAISRATLVLVGCDAIQPGYFANKTGTAALAALARRSRVPFHVAADSFKLLPSRAALWFRVREERPAQIWPSPPQRVLVRNSYFERTPLRLCATVILETGGCPPGEIRALLRGKQIAEGFARSTPETRPAANARNE